MGEREKEKTGEKRRRTNTYRIYPLKCAVTLDIYKKRGVIFRPSTRCNPLFI